MAVELFLMDDGRCPYREWLEGLCDPVVRDRVDTRMNRAHQGNLGDVRSVGAGVWEFRLQFGAGYRVYFGRHGETIVVLLCGGDKSSQDADIALARQHWNRYRERHGD